jgi:hypothetical protein
MTAPAPDQDQDQDQAVDPATGQISNAVLDAVIDQTDQRRADRAAEGERAKATAEGPCSRCGAGESWLKPGRGGWHRDAKGPICQPCHLDMRAFGRPDGAIMSDSEHRAKVIADLIGPDEARQQYPPLLLAKAADILAWWCEVPGARRGQGPERFGYVDLPALLAHPLLHAPPPPPPVLRSRGRRSRCPSCGCKGECWTVEQVGVPAAVASDGTLSQVARAHFRLTWTCHSCRHVEVEQRAEQLPDVPVRLQVG